MMSVQASRLTNYPSTETVTIKYDYNYWENLANSD